MSSRSIVDRVLLVAAALCAAGLAWQLTVLLTSRSAASTARRVEAVSTASAPSSGPMRSVDPVQPVATSAAVPAGPAIRVVYPDASTPKMIGKATDTPEGTPVALASPAVMNSLSPAPAATAAAYVPTRPDPAPTPEPARAAPTAAPAASALASPAPTPSAPAQVASLAPAPAADAPPAGKGGIDINRASVEALNHLPGAGRIGQAIASHRPYRSVEDLLRKRVVRRSVYDQIKHQLAAE